MTGIETRAAGATVITIFGTTYFTIGAGLVVLVLVAPLLLWFSRWALRPNIEDKPLRVRWLAVGGLTFTLLLLTAVGLFWDVYLIGQRAKELCAETGLVVYRTVPAKSFIGSTDIRSWAHEGFEFVEKRTGSKLYRIELVGGTEIQTEIPHFESTYELTRSVGNPTGRARAIDQYFTILSYEVVDRFTEKPLGLVSAVTIEHGWADRLLIRYLGFIAPPPVCGKDNKGKIVTNAARVGVIDLIRATLAR